MYIGQWIIWIWIMDASLSIVCRCLVFVNLIKKTPINATSLPACPLLHSAAQSTPQHMLSCYECIKGYRSQKTCQVVSRKMRAKEVCMSASLSYSSLSWPLSRRGPLCCPAACWCWRRGPRVCRPCPRCRCRRTSSTGTTTTLTR